MYRLLGKSTKRVLEPTLNVGLNRGGVRMLIGTETQFSISHFLLFVKSPRYYTILITNIFEPR